MWWLVLAACGGPEAYAPCEEAEDCEVPDDVTAECLDKSGAGFCAWTCAVDADCDDPADPDRDDREWVCASFESEEGLHCFPSCEDGETTADGDPVCPEGTGCRSTGGGSDNRKICFPSEDPA